MVDIRHRVGIAASPSDVYGALATRDGLAGWWTEDVQGDPAPDGRLTFTFGESYRAVVMQVVSSTPGRQVGWRCVEGPEEWIDTTLSFDLEAADGETVVRFAHAGWKEPVDFLGHCSTKWASFLFSLKDDLEGKEAAPFPHDVKISGWG